MIDSKFSDKSFVVNLNVEKCMWILLILLTIFSRFYDLGSRVISHDESLHTYYSWELSRGEGFEHTPLMHGPFQFHALAFVYFLFGDTDFTSRVPSAIFGVLAVGILWWYRDLLGRAGAFIAGCLMCISPIMLYYTRYVRNESFVVVFVLIMALSFWKYLKYKQDKWLYLFVAAIAFNHTSKEVAFLYDAIWMIFVGLLFVNDNMKSDWRNPLLKRIFIFFIVMAIILGLIATLILQVDVLDLLNVDGDGGRLDYFLVIPALMAVIFGLFSGILVCVARWNVIKDYASFDLLLVMITLILPQLTAFPVKYLLNSNPIDYSVVGIWKSVPVLIFLLLVSMWLGLSWDKRRWVLCALIFYSIYVVFFTTIFTNGNGLATGFMGSLGYWIEQQSVERGGQPWYYYILVMIPMYEYLPFLGLIIGFVLYVTAIRNDRMYESKLWYRDSSLVYFNFLFFWCFASILIYMLAGEKMPWLTVHLSLPMIIISGWAFGILLQRIDWNKLFGVNFTVLLLVLLLAGISMTQTIISILNVLSIQSTSVNLYASRDWLEVMSSVVLLVVMIVLLYKFVSKVGWLDISRLINIMIVGVFGVLTIRTAIGSSYIRYDEQTEFINYASGAPGIRVVMEQVEEISRRTTDGLSIRIGYDDDVSWPFTWYLRHYDNQVFVGGEPTRDLLQDSDLVIAGNNNWPEIESILRTNYSSFEYIRMWWPMQDYFGLNSERIMNNLLDPQRLSALWNIWYMRDYTQYGSINGVDYSLSRWPVVDKMRFYVSRKLTSKMWDISSMSTLDMVDSSTDPFEDVHIIREADKLINTVFDDDEGMDRPKDVSISDDGFIYVADTFNHRILKFDNQGKLVLQWGFYGSVYESNERSNGLNEPWGIDVSKDGFVYVADTWNHRIVKYDLEGDFVLSWGGFGDDADLYSMWGPREVLVGQDGMIYVADTGNKRISVFTDDGQIVRQVGRGGLGSGEFEEPVGLSLDSVGNLYVADTWNARIQVFDNEGKFLYEWDVLEWDGQSLDNKPYLAIDDKENKLYATAPEGYRILVWDLLGEPLMSWGDFGKEMNSFDLPTGIDIDSSGGIYLADSENNRVLYFMGFVDK